MANYNETVLYSSMLGAAGAFNLSQHPSAFNYLKVSYGSPVIGRTATSLDNLGPMMTVTVPTGMSYLNLYSNFYGNVSANTFYTPYRACHTLSATNTSAWKSVFNRYGLTNSWEVRTNAAWTNVYSVVGVTTGMPTDYHVDSLYDVNKNGSGNTITMQGFPSAYERIGIIVGLNNRTTSLNFQSVKFYQEYSYNHIKQRSGYLITYSKYSDTPLVKNNLFQGALYKGCSGKSWNYVVGRYLFETGDNGATSNDFGRIYRVIGINRTGNP